MSTPWLRRGGGSRSGVGGLRPAIRIRVIKKIKKVLALGCDFWDVCRRMKTDSLNSFIPWGAVALLLLAHSPPAHSANRFWNSPNSGLWGNTTNWDGGNIANNPADNAYFGSYPINSGTVIDLAGSTYQVLDVGLNAADYTLANGTIALSGNMIRNAAGNVTVSAGLSLQSGQHAIGGTTGYIRLTGPISGSGGIDARYSSPLTISGINTMTGDFRMGDAYVWIGSNSSFGSGNLILGNLTSLTNIPTIATATSNAQSITNKVYDRARRMDVGDTDASGRNGTITFTNDFYFDDTGVAGGDRVGNRDMWISQTVVFQKGITNTAGTDGNKTLNLVGRTTSAIAAFEGTSDRSGDTYIGTNDGRNMRVIAKADNALGTGNVYVSTTNVGANRAGLTLDGSLTGGITLANNVYNVIAGSPYDFITSKSGNNTISGNVRINAHDSASTTPILVTDGSLTFSGGLSGYSATASNWMRKDGAGILVLTGTTTQGVGGLVIANGTLRGVEGTAWSTNGTTGQVINFNGNNTGA